MRSVVAEWLGRTSYEDARVAQENAVLAIRDGGEADRLLLLEHDDVITIGRSAGVGHVLISPELARRRGVTVVESDRGGDVTYHGPGQLIGYPIVLLSAERRDLHGYLRDLEQVLIDVLALLGIEGERRAGKTGVWVGGEKIASLGVRVSRWITSHGFALNVTTDLARFDWIVPCGIEGCRMTSIAQLTGERHDVRDVARVVAEAFARRFDAPLVWNAAVPA